MIPAVKKSSFFLTDTQRISYTWIMERTNQMNQAFPKFSEVMNDAGLLREYVALRYGQVLLFGGTWATWRRAGQLIKLLAAMTGLGFDEVLAAIRSDAEVRGGKEN